MQATQRQRGFTLVEIAIVLVIIGLLLGGILKGQELITSARVRNLADQNSGIQAAYYGFIDRYRQVPGDMLAAGPRGACNVIGNDVPGCPGAGVGGNGNGRLDDEDWGEASNAWSHLSAARFIQGSYTGNANSAATYAAIDKSPANVFQGYVMVTRSDEFETNASGASRLVYVFGRNIPVNVIRELDLKIDDGQPQTGVLRSTPSSGGGLGDIAVRTAACIVASGTIQIWDINADEQDCNAVFLY
jgi:prepilin-type N-terminal cleavage/methylation domain-containing protein